MLILEEKKVLLSVNIIGGGPLKLSVVKKEILVTLVKYVRSLFWQFEGWFLAKWSTCH